MARILFLVFSGGGNLPPSLGIARALSERGHEAVFAGEPEMIPRMKATPFRAIEFTDAYAQLELYKKSPFGAVACYLSSPAVAAQARAIIEAEKPDFILVDFLFFAARLAAKARKRANAIMAHMALLRVAEPFRGLIDHLNGLHDEAGLAPLPSLDELIFSGERVIVTSLAAVEQGRAALRGAGNVRYVGPALEMEAHARRIALPWSKDDKRPLALISFSTDPIQAAPALVQRTLDALAPLDLRVVATVGRAIDPDGLAVPANAVVTPAADHDALMAAAALVVTHGGHGTVMRALKHGAPMLVLPGFIPDQAPNAAIVAELGAGRILGQDSDAAAIRAAAENILGNPEYRAKARRAAGLFGPRDGALGAADEVEALLARKSAAEPA